MQLSPQYDIETFTYAGTDCTLLSASLDADNSDRMIFELFLNSEMGYLSIDVALTSGEMLSGSFYAVENGCGVFISQFSYDDAYEEYFNYALEEGILTERECSEIRQERYRKGVEFTPNLESGSLFPNDSVNATGQDTVISGKVQWKDDSGNLHSLRRVMVKIYDRNVGYDTHIGTVFTNSLGSYSLTFSTAGDGDLDLFARIYAGDGNAMVYIGDSNNQYYIDSEVYNNVETGRTISMNTIKIDMSSDIGKAMQISQAILTARDYAWDMMGHTPENVTVYYPVGDGCEYNVKTKTIKITGKKRISLNAPNSYASWDVIMHEYGHHIQQELQISNNPGGNHYFTGNHADDRDDKDIGIRLAWAEA